MNQGNNYNPPPNIPGFNRSLSSHPQVKTTMNFPQIPGFNQIPSGLSQDLPLGIPPGNSSGPPQGFIPGPPQGFIPGPPQGFIPGPPQGLIPGPPQGLIPGPPQGLIPEPPQWPIPGPPKGLPQVPQFNNIPLGFPQASSAHQQAKVNNPMNQSNPIVPNKSNLPNPTSIHASNFGNANLPNFNNNPGPSGSIGYQQFPGAGVNTNPYPNTGFNPPVIAPPQQYVNNIPGNLGVPNQQNYKQIPGPPGWTGYQQSPGTGANFNPNPNIGFNPSVIPPPPQYNPNNFSPQYSQDSSIKSLSSSNKTYINASKEVSCTSKTGSIIKSHNLHIEISNKYGGKINLQGNKFLVEGENQPIVDLMCDELNNLIKQYTFDDNARWSCLQNDGSYKYYDDTTNELIEDKYRMFYPELTSPDYQNYSLSIDLTIAAGSYVLEFARLGGVHRQKRKNVDSTVDTIRAVKRQANGEDLNKNFVRNYRWEWWHESRQFRPYEDDAIFLIEHSYIEYTSKKTKSPIVLIQGCNQKTYRLDFSEFSQYNEKSDYKRKIRRIQL